MANSIRVLDMVQPIVKFEHLKQGQLFRFVATYNTENVYMKVYTQYGGSGNYAALLLTTGVVYSNFDLEKALEVIPAIEIKTA